MPIEDLSDQKLRDLRAKAFNSLREPEDERYDYHGTQVLIQRIDAELRRRDAQRV